MEVIGTSKQLETKPIETPNGLPTPITATPPNTPKTPLSSKMMEVSTISISDTFSIENDQSPENRRKSVPTETIFDINTMSPDLPQQTKRLSDQFDALKLAQINETYDPKKYTDNTQFDNAHFDIYAQSSPKMERVKIESPSVSPITSELNSIDEDEGRFSEFIQVFRGEQLNRFVSDENMADIEESEPSFVFEDSKSFLNNVREISYESDDESLLH